ncbi:MAG: hypothetical protein QXU32_12960 [Nitrososphaerales archaeon]
MSSIHCPCCGEIMEAEEELEMSIRYRCKGCGLSDTRLKRKSDIA